MRKPLSNDAVRARMDAIRARMDYWNGVPVENIRPCISKGNQKIGDVMNVSLAPGITCGAAGAACLNGCYAVNDLRYPSVIDARARNTVIFKRDRALFFREIRAAISKRHPDFFRWHVAGEIVDADHFREIIATAAGAALTRFWTYTKRHDIVNAYCAANGGRAAIPENLSIMFSKWFNIPIDNPYGFPVFHTVAEIDPDGPWVCPGKCDICIAARRGCPFGEDVQALFH